MQPSEESWQHFEHLTDNGVRGFGLTTSAAFENAAKGLTAALTDLMDVRPTEDTAHRLGLARKVARLRPVVCIKG